MRFRKVRGTDGDPECIRPVRCLKLREQCGGGEHDTVAIILSALTTDELRFELSDASVDCARKRGGAERVEVSTRERYRARFSNFFELHVITQRKLAGQRFQDLELRSLILTDPEIDQLIKTPRPEQRGVDEVGSIRSGDDKNIRILRHPINLRQ